jgi:hypothetical protein
MVRLPHPNEKGLTVTRKELARLNEILDRLETVVVALTGPPSRPELRLVEPDEEARSE